MTTEEMIKALETVGYHVEYVGETWQSNRGVPPLGGRDLRVRLVDRCVMDGVSDDFDWSLNLGGNTVKEYRFT